MIKKLIATTFLSAALAMPAMAAGTATTNGAADGGANSTATGSMDSGAKATLKANPDAAGMKSDNMDNSSAMNSSADSAITAQGSLEASNIIGTSVTDGKGNSIGEIGDILLSSQGQVTNYVINVGGFLGIGDKPVALTPKDVTIMPDGNGDLKASTTLTKEELNSRPEYKKAEAKLPSAAMPDTMKNTTAPAAPTPAKPAAPKN